ncbi:trypsin-like serine protease [Streptomyces roseicoloratus]|uniref:trypsin-like serine protease n=1 Tax=Streptomyces roseicoloratus TaxID=2508722 RepID=UPI001009A9FC|nr:trypsin-like serine protease [Streptomyces roseicoloratus]
MPRINRRSSWIAAGVTAAVGTGLLSSMTAQAAVGAPDTGSLAYTGRVTVGDEATSRGCSATLVAGDWLLSAKSCFGTDVAAGAPKDPVKAFVGAKTYKVTEVVPRADRDVVLLHLDGVATGTTPVKLGSAAPAADAAVTAAGHGRTKTEWLPGKVHTASFKATTSDTTTVTLEAAEAGNTICQGDAGGPVLNAAGELIALNSRSWQGGCLGTDPAETRTGAIAVRTDDLTSWITQNRITGSGWKTGTVIQSGSTLYQGIRLADGTWTRFDDVQTKASNIGGIRTATAAGINGDTHVLAIATNGTLQHTIRKADGTWIPFGNVGDVAGHLGSLTQVTAVSIGNDLHVVAVANGKVFHSLRNATGHWSQFADLAGVVGPIGTVTQVAAANADGQLQLLTVSGGKALHTLRTTAGHWSTWGNITQAAAGPTSPVTGVAIAGVEGDAHVVVTTDNGARQYHAIRKANASWDAFGELTGYLGNITTKSLSAAHVDGELQLTAVTTDNKVVHTIRHADRTWSTTPITLPGVSGTLGTISITGTL